MLEHFEGFLLAGDASKDVKRKEGRQVQRPIRVKNGKNPSLVLRP